jgi:hypothetical protein
VRALRLGGLDEAAARALLADKGLAGDDAAWGALVARYAGNALGLQVVAETVGAVFGETSPPSWPRGRRCSAESAAF